MNDRISFSEDLVAVSGGKSPAQNDRNLTAAASAPSRLVMCRVAKCQVWFGFGLGLVRVWVRLGSGSKCRVSGKFQVFMIFIFCNSMQNRVTPTK